MWPDPLKPAPHLRTFPWICASNKFAEQIRQCVGKFVRTNERSARVERFLNMLDICSTDLCDDGFPLIFF